MLCSNAWVCLDVKAPDDSTHALLCTFFLGAQYCSLLNPESLREHRLQCQTPCAAQQSRVQLPVAARTDHLRLVDMQLPISCSTLCLATHPLSRVWQTLEDFAISILSQVCEPHLQINHGSSQICAQAGMFCLSALSRAVVPSVAATVDGLECGWSLACTLVKQ